MFTASRRSILASALGVLVLGSAPALADDSYPTKPVRIITGFQPGGVSDTIARVVGERLGEQLGQPFVVDGRPGAGGMLSMGLAAAAPADGYTIYLGQPVMTISPNFRRKLDFHPIKAFAPISVIGLGATMMVVSAKTPANTVEELVAYAKSRPQGLLFGHSGQGSTNHLAGELFKVTAGIDLTPVAYKGAAANTLAVVQGEVDLAFMPVLPALPAIRNGQIKGIGITSAQRSAAAPDIPTIGESLPGYQVPVWYGFVAPAGTPEPIVERLNAEIKKALETPSVRELLSKQGVDPHYTTTAEFATFLDEDAARWAKLVKDAQIELE